MASPVLQVKSSPQASGTTSVTPVLSWTPRPGHLLITDFYGNASSLSAWTQPSGYSTAQSAWAGTSNVSRGAFYKTAVGNETSPSSTVTGSSNSLGGIYEFGGVSTTINANPAIVTGLSQTVSVTSSAFTPTVGDLVIAYFGGSGALTVESWSSSQTMTPALTAIGTIGNYSIAWGVATSSSSQTVTFTFTGTSTTAIGVMTFKATQPTWPGNISLLGVG